MISQIPFGCKSCRWFPSDVHDRQNPCISALADMAEHTNGGKQWRESDKTLQGLGRLVTIGCVLTSTPELLMQRIRADRDVEEPRPAA